MDEKICYNCVAEMKRVKKKLGVCGGMKYVYQCPECGNMEPEKSSYIEGKEIDSINEMKQSINDNKPNNYIEY